MADQPFLNFIDMINGGGAGRAGSKFEGGGLLSMLGNALGIRPYGYEDRLSQMRPQARPTGLLSTQGQTRPQARPLPMTGMDETLVPGPIYSGRGDVGMPVPNVQMPAEIGNSGSGMGLPQYSGRGTVGMPIPPALNTPDGRAVLEYLRSVGAVNY